MPDELTKVQDAIVALTRRAKDARLTIIPGLAADLLKIAAALDELDKRAPPLPPPHPVDCECRSCCLVRLAAAHWETAPVSTP